MPEIQSHFSSKKTVKFCTSCKAWLNVNKFGKNAIKPDKLQTYCRTCATQHVKKSAETHPIKKIQIVFSVEEHKQFMDYCKQHKLTASQCIRDIVLPTIKD